jgi:hypothetical protein
MPTGLSGSAHTHALQVAAQLTYHAYTGKGVESCYIGRRFEGVLSDMRSRHPLQIISGRL